MPSLLPADCLSAERSVSRTKSQSFCFASASAAACSDASSGTASSPSPVIEPTSRPRNSSSETAPPARLLMAATPTRIAPGALGLAVAAGAALSPGATASGGRPPDIMPGTPITPEGTA